MKILIISDIHGSSYYADKIREIEERENPDKIVLLGDLYYGPRNNLTEEYNKMKVAGVLNDFGEKVITVRGNCDTEIDEMISYFKFEQNLQMQLNGKNVFFTHGNIYNIHNIPNDEVEIMFYGHLHTGFIKKENGIIFANPGSISLPRKDTEHSYIIFDENKIILKDVDGKVIDDFVYKD